MDGPSPTVCSPEFGRGTEPQVGNGFETIQVRRAQRLSGLSSDETQGPGEAPDAVAILFAHETAAPASSTFSEHMPSPSPAHLVELDLVSVASLPGNGPGE